MARKKRSTRSYLVELIVTLIAIGAIYLFLVNGGPSVAGQFWAELIGAP